MTIAFYAATPILRMAIADNCELGRKILPRLPCTRDMCAWYIRAVKYKNCFWSVAAKFVDAPTGSGISVEEIARMENTSVDEVNAILEAAQRQIRVNYRKTLIDI